MANREQGDDARRFAGKVVVITGAAGGIGRAAALRFAGEGARVVAVDVQRPAVEETVALVRAAGGAAHAALADVTRAADFARVAEEAVVAFGGVDCLFNNAGVEGVFAPLLAYPEDAFDQVLAVNVKGVWLGIKALAPLLRARGGGAIVNTASVAGLIGTAGNGAYGASKHAVVGLTRTAARELAADGIRVNAVCPGFVDTRMMGLIEAAASPADPVAARARLQASVPLQRYAEPAEIAAFVAYLCSPDASYITGGAFAIDGGRLA
jgi:NAD(P)-dependent dehydrogenase (short-subunit alcohol dehydrogenase family)